MQFVKLYERSTMIVVLCLFVVLMVLSYSCAYAADGLARETLYPIREGDLWGYMDYDGKIVIKPQWQECGKFRAGKYAFVSYGWHQDGIINILGDYVYKPQYSIAAYERNEYYGDKDTGVYWFMRDDYQGFLDVESGYFSGFCLSYGTDPWFDGDETIIKVTFDGITYGYMDRTNGELVIPCIFADMTNGQFKNGYVCDRIYNTDIVIVMDEKANQLKLPKDVTIDFFNDYDGYLERFFDNRLIVKDRQTGLFGYCDSNGQLVIPTIYESVDAFYEGYAAVKVDGFWAHININGDLMFKALYTSPYSFSQERAVIDDGTSIEVIDYQGNVIRTFDNASQSMQSYSQYGVTLYTDYNQLWIIDLNGNEVGSSYAYDSETYSNYLFAEGIHVFIQNGKFGYVDYMGNIISDFIWDYGEDFSDGLAYVEKDGKMAYINKAGQIVWIED